MKYQPMNQNQRPLLIGTKEAAHLLGVGERTILRLIAQGVLESIKVRRRRLVKMESLLKFVGAGTDLAAYKRVISPRL